MTGKGGKQRLWTQDEAILAAELWENRDSHRYQTLNRIAATLKRSYDSVEYRFKSFGPTFGSMQRSTRRATPEQLREQANRLDAENRQSLIARLLGDPPPGYSALDARRQSGVAR